jgi:hypothetical protein
VYVPVATDDPRVTVRAEEDPEVTDAGLNTSLVTPLGGLGSVNVTLCGDPLVVEVLKR